MDANELQARFPRTSQYDPEWILEMGMGSHPLSSSSSQLGYSGPSGLTG